MRSLVAVLWVLAMGSTAVAGEGESTKAAEERDRGFRHESSLQIRVEPPGLKYKGDTAFRLLLKEREHILLGGRYIDTGITTELSPAFLWTGPYVEALPISALKLRASASYTGYFGTFGHLHVSEEGDGSPEARERTSELGVAQSATGWRIALEATPRILIGRVGIAVDTALYRVAVDVEHTYYEPAYGLMLEPEDTVWEINPTVGYLFGSDPSQRYSLVGLRWERRVVRNTEWEQDKFGIVAMFSVPPELMDWGSPVISSYAALRRKLPEESSLAPYFGIQGTLSF